MALILVARYHTLSEAEVAASLLRSAGIESMIADAHFGGIFWVQQAALGGYRLSVLDEDRDEAVALLRALPQERLDEPEDDDLDEVEASAPTSMSASQRAASVGLALALGPEAGWAATSRRVGASMSDGPFGGILAVALLAGIGGLATALLTFAIMFVAELLNSPP